MNDKPAPMLRCSPEADGAAADALQDMGGAALVAALGHLVMSHKLPVRLRLLVPAVENSISGNAFRQAPGRPLAGQGSAGNVCFVTYVLAHALPGRWTCCRPEQA